MSGAKSGAPAGEVTSLLHQKGASAGTPTTNPLRRAWRALPPTARVLLIIVTEIALSVALNFYNSYLLRHVPGFHFPLIYTAVHMSTSHTVGPLSPLPPSHGLFRGYTRLA